MEIIYYNRDYKLQYRLYIIMEMIYYNVDYIL